MLTTLAYIPVEKVHSAFYIKSIQWNLDNSKSKGPNSFVYIIETLNN